MEQILSFKGKPQFGRAMSAREASKKSKKLFPLVIMGENMEVYPYILIQEISSLQTYALTAYLVIEYLFRTLSSLICPITLWGCVDTTDNLQQPLST